MHHKLTEVMVKVEKPNYTILEQVTTAVAVAVCITFSLKSFLSNCASVKSFPKYSSEDQDDIFHILPMHNVNPSNARIAQHKTSLESNLSYIIICFETGRLMEAINVDINLRLCDMWY